MAFYKRPKPLPRLERTQRDWSNYQRDIFREVAFGESNVIINAVPGSGKSATITESLYHLNPMRRASSIFLAFGKRDQLHLQRSVPEDIPTFTAHGLGVDRVRKAFSKVKIDVASRTNLGKGERIARMLVGSEDSKQNLRFNINKCVSLCKAYLAYEANDIEEVIVRHGIDTDGDHQFFINTIVEALELHAQQVNIIDFDDMIWFIHRYGIPFEQYDNVFVDETQDFTNAQLNILFNLVSPNGRIIAALDRNQELYGWRAASGVADLMQEELNPKNLPLSVSYRCPKSVIQLANKICSDIEPAPNAIEGMVEQCGKDRMYESAMPGDLILSRTNAPLVRLCMRFLKEGRRATIQGKNIKWSFIYMINSSSASTIDDFSAWLNDWYDRECAWRVAKRRPTDYIEDKYQCMVSFCENATTLDDVRNNIHSVFSDIENEDEWICLSSVHRAKGRERNRVYYLQYTCKPHKGIEERNIEYVAITRAMKELYLVQRKMVA